MKVITRGILFIIFASFSFSIMNIMAKYLNEMHPMQVVFHRAFGTFIFIFPYMLWKKVPLLGTHRKILLFRSLLGLASLATFFIVIQRIPLGSAISIRYSSPIFGAFMAFLFLKEKINYLQWISFGIAFAGVIVLKGFDIRIDFLSLGLIIFSSILVGGVFVILRYLGDKEHHLTIINYFMTFSIIGSLCFVMNFRMPIGLEWISVIGIGIFGMIGQIFMTRAFQLEEASVLAPFKYMELIFALIVAYFLFGESYTIFAFLGIVMILAGMLMNVFVKDKAA